MTIAGTGFTLRILRTIPNFVLSSALLPRERLRYWIATIGRFSLVQVGAQALTALSGLLIVRTLSKQEYALFLVANTMQGTMNILADAGATIGLTTLGGKFWQDRYRLGQIVNATLQVRRKMMVISMLGLLPLLSWFLYRNGATPIYATLITLATLAGLYFIIGANISRVVLQLHSRIRRLQQNDLLVPLARFVCVATASVLFFDAALAIAVMSLIYAVQWRWLTRWASEEADSITAVDPADTQFIYTKVREVMPGSLFYCLQSQVYIFILSLYGKTDHLAEVGALSRLAVFFSVVTTVMHSLVVPAFARCQQPRVLRRRYVQIVAAFILLGTTLVALATACPRPLLWVLGSRYANLQQALVLSVAVTATNGLADAMWLLNGAKGWTKHSWIGIPLQLALQATLLFCLDVQTVCGVLVFSLLAIVPPMGVSAVLAWRGLFEHRAITNAV